MNAHEAGRGDLVKRARDKKRKREEKKIEKTKEVVTKALTNGIRLTFSTVPVKGEVKLAKVLRKIDQEVR